MLRDIRIVHLNPHSPLPLGASAASYVTTADEPVLPASKGAPICISARDLCDMKFEPIKYVVPGYLAEGATILAGTPKLGKSWFCLEIALAVASGGVCLGNVVCEAGEVLYLALEDNRRRLQSRINRLWQLEGQAHLPVPARLHLATEWPRSNEGGIDEIRNWLSDHPSARLVIVDVLAMFKAINKGKDQTLYEADYMAVKGLQQLASEIGVAIVIVHHTRKGMGDLDPFDAISGTLGLSGAADTGLVLRRDQNGVTLYGRGRDIEEIETAVQFDKATCKWIALGQATEVRRTDERSVILVTLADNREPMTPTELAGALGLPVNNVKQLLFKMAKAGEVLKFGKKGRYAHPDHAGYSDSPISPDNPDNRDNRRYGDEE